MICSLIKKKARYVCLTQQSINSREFGVYVLVLPHLLKLHYQFKQEKTLKTGRKKTEVDVACKSRPKQKGLNITNNVTSKKRNFCNYMITVNPHVIITLKCNKQT